MSQKPSVSQNSVPVPNLVSQKPSVAKPVFALCHSNRFADVTRRAASGSDALAGRGDTGDAFEGEGRRSPLLAGSFDAGDAPGPKRRLPSFQQLDAIIHSLFCGLANAAENWPRLQRSRLLYSSCAAAVS